MSEVIEALKQDPHVMLRKGLVRCIVLNEGGSPPDETEPDDPAICRCPCHTPTASHVVMHMFPCCGKGSEHPEMRPPDSPPASQSWRDRPPLL